MTCNIGRERQQAKTTSPRVGVYNELQIEV